MTFDVSISSSIFMNSPCIILLSASAEYEAISAIHNTEEKKKALELLCDPILNPRQKITIGVSKNKIYLAVNSFDDNSNLYNVILAFRYAGCPGGGVVNNVLKQFSCHNLPALVRSDRTLIIQFTILKGAQKMHIHPIYNTVYPRFCHPLEVELQEPEVNISFVEAKATETYVHEKIGLKSFRCFMQRSRLNETSHQLSIVRHRFPRNVSMQIGTEALLMPEDCHWKFTWPFMELLEKSTFIVDEYIKPGVVDNRYAFLHFVGKTMVLGFYATLDEFIKG